MTTETADLAIEAGLRFVEPGEPGLRRVRRGRGFSYESHKGAAINGSREVWIESLVIPPAWEEVWICTDRDGHILATGTDKAGRKQYIYHCPFRNAPGHSASWPCRTARPWSDVRVWMKSS